MTSWAELGATIDKAIEQNLQHLQGLPEFFAELASDLAPIWAKLKQRWDETGEVK